MPGVIFSASGTIASLASNFYDISKTGLSQILLNSLTGKNKISIPPKVTCSLIIQIVLRSQDGTEHAYLSRQLLLASDESGMLTYIGQQYNFGNDINDSNWEVDIVINQQTGELKIIVPGDQLWIARIDGIQVSPTGK